MRLSPVEPFFFFSAFQFPPLLSVRSKGQMRSLFNVFLAVFLSLCYVRDAVSFSQTVEVDLMTPLAASTTMDPTRFASITIDISQARDPRGFTLETNNARTADARERRERERGRREGTERRLCDATLLFPLSSRSFIRSPLAWEERRYAVDRKVELLYGS